MSRAAPPETARPATRWARLDRYQLLLLALAAPLLLFPGPWSVAGLAVVGLTWVARRRARGAWSARTYLDRPGLALLGMMAVGLLVSVDLPLSLNRAAVLLLGFALFYGLANGLPDERAVYRTGVALILVGIGAAVVSLLATDWQLGALAGLPQPAWIYAHLPRLLRRLPGSGVLLATDLLSPRLVAGTMAFLLPVPLAFLVWGRGARLRLLCLAAVLIMGLTLALSQSPQGLLGLAVAVLVCGVVRCRPVRWALLPGAVALFVLWQAALIGVLPPALTHRLWTGVTSRFPIWERALMMIRDMPVTGIGLNTFPTVDDGFYNLIPDRTVHAHNVLLQTTVDLGIPGLIALLVLLVAFARATRRAYLAAADPNVRTLLLGVAGGVAAWLGFGVADAISIGHKPAVALWAMLGLVAAVGRIHGAAPAPWPRWTRRPAAWAGAGLLLLAAAFLFRDALLVNAASVLAHRAEAGATGPVPASVSTLAATARAANPANSRAAFLLGDTARRNGQAATAVTDLQVATRLDPRDAMASYQLGWAAYARGDLAAATAAWGRARDATDVRALRPVLKQVLQDARDAYAQNRLDAAAGLYTAAAALDGTRTEPWSGLAFTQIRQGRPDQAIATDQAFIARFPTQAAGYTGLAGLLYDRDKAPAPALAVLETGRAKVIGGPGLAALDEQEARIEFQAGNLARAATLATQGSTLDANCGGCWALLGDLAAGQGQGDQALVYYRRSVATTNAHWQWAAHRAMATVYLTRGDHAAAFAEFQQAATLAGPDGATGAEIAGVYSDMADALHDAGRRDEAAAAYRQALSLDPGNRHARDALAALP